MRLSESADSWTYSGKNMSPRKMTPKILDRCNMSPTEIAVVCALKGALFASWATYKEWRERRRLLRAEQAWGGPRTEHASIGGRALDRLPPGNHRVGAIENGR